MFKAHFQKPWWSAWYRIQAKRNSNYPFMWWLIVLQYEVWLLFSSWCKYWWSEDQEAGWGSEVAVPLWLQSGVRSISLQCVMLLILLHGLLAVPTCWAAFNSCADFDLSYFFHGISIFSVTCVRNTQPKLRMSKPCWCLPYVDLSWDIFFLISLIYSTSQSPYGYCFFLYSSGSLSFAFQRFATETILSGTLLCAWFI